MSIDGPLGLSAVTVLLAVPSWLAAAVLLAVAGLAIVVLVLTRAVDRERRRTAALLERAAADAEQLRGQLAQIEAQMEARFAEDPLVAERAGREPVLAEREYLITDLGRDARQVAPIVPAPVFVDIVLRESLIRTAALAAGLRRALSPEVRNRVRFEMRREVKRARKQRKDDLRTARREFEARQRAEAGASEMSGTPVSARTTG